MDDLISRQAVIDAIDDIESKVADGDGFQYEKWRQYFCNLPSAQPEHRWIPCSERLPEENMWTTCQNNAGAMMIGKYDIEFGWMFPAYFDGIVAWQPRPEPWKGEDDE